MESACRRLLAWYGRHGAYIDMGIGATLNSLMMAMMKELIGKRNVPTTAVVFVRMLCTTFVTGLSLAAASRCTLQPSAATTKTVQGWLLARGIVGTASFWFIYAALQYLPMEDQQAIWYTCPIITAIIAFCWLREPWRMLEVICGLASMAGVLMVVQPAAIVLQHDSDAPATPRTSMLHKWQGFAYALGGTILGALALVIIRHIGKRASVTTSLFYFGWIATISTGFIMLLDASERPTKEVLDGLSPWLLTGVAVLGTGATWLMNRAVQKARPGRVSLIMYIQLPLILFLDYAVFHYVASLLGLAGCGIIVLSASVISLSKDDNAEEEQGQARYDNATSDYDAVPMTASDPSLRDKERDAGSLASSARAYDSMALLAS